MDAINSKLWEQVKHKCGTCGAPATHSVTDAKQTEAGWLETDPRFGCTQHPVKSKVHFLDGTSILHSEYVVQ